MNIENPRIIFLINSTELFDEKWKSYLLENIYYFKNAPMQGEIIDLINFNISRDESFCNDFVKEFSTRYVQVDNVVHSTDIDTTLFVKPYEFESSLKEKSLNEPNSFKLKIEKLPLSKALITLLQNQEILTVGDLVSYTENGLENIKFMKWIGVKDIKNALANMGLRLGMKTYQ